MGHSNPWSGRAATGQVLRCRTALPLQRLPHRMIDKGRCRDRSAARHPKGFVGPDGMLSTRTSAKGRCSFNQAILIDPSGTIGPGGIEPAPCTEWAACADGPGKIRKCFQGRRYGLRCPFQAAARASVRHLDCDVSQPGRLGGDHETAKALLSAAGIVGPRPRARKTDHLGPATNSRWRSRVCRHHRLRPVQENPGQENHSAYASPLPPNAPFLKRDGGVVAEWSKAHPC